MIDAAIQELKKNSPGLDPIPLYKYLVNEHVHFPGHMYSWSCFKIYTRICLPTYYNIPYIYIQMTGNLSWSIGSFRGEIFARATDHDRHFFQSITT